jgi:hypothetical protein
MSRNTVMSARSSATLCSASQALSHYSDATRSLPRKQGFASTSARARSSKKLTSFSPLRQLLFGEQR